MTSAPDHVARWRSYSPRHTPWPLIWLALAGLVVLVLLSVTYGSLAIRFGALLSHLMSYVGAGNALEPFEANVFNAIRLPRVLMAAVAGGLLAAAGVLMQCFFRNPLAEPSIVGVASGGALGAVAWIVLGAGLVPALQGTVYALPIFALLGSLAACVTIIALSRGEAGIDATTMLLAGIAVNAIAGAGIGLMTFLADDAQLRDLTFWIMGSLSAASWENLAIMAPVALVLVVFSLLMAPQLNALLLGDEAAHDLGMNVAAVKAGVIVLTCLGSAVVTALCGVIGFVGLIAPHMARLLVGPDHRVLVPLGLILGSALMVAADTVARTIVSPSELPIGILTALAGGPLFLWLLRGHGGWKRRA